LALVEVSVNIYRSNPEDSLSLVELDFYRRMMAYRRQNGLSDIPLSSSLTTTGGRHAVDTYYNIWSEDLSLPEGANLHSWSDAPYFDDHRQPEIMWFAPQRIGTPYPSAGYEITAAGYANVAAALKGWQSSTGHSDVILNKALWADLNWNAIGIGVLNGSESVGGSLRGNIYHVWFGEEVDPAGPPLIMGTRGADRIRGTRFDDVINGGGGNDIIKGGAGQDSLIGAGGADLLNGGPGNDILKGGSGADRFRFDSALNSNTNVDRITDFKRAQGDRIELARSVFKRLPAGRTLAASAFGVGSSFTSRAERILYDPAIGSLTYDSNGSAAGGTSAVFAILGNLPTIDHSVFTLI
jgi:Ca2+-binding RTX toxin-like protein